ncbi:hypothetical protein CBP51_05000 [Cellvibrio mixtus]|uniref:Permease n=1 Tax=Cellvibrio mixtus TaxID=39650 RepID=A0A266Q913_9GAMM|nr:ABC transporter permease [Cellvibrio mixtus]OZY86387.1 hypothetical protein CBP51_05000 [Cellvibrio mixtus]
MNKFINRQKQAWGNLKKRPGFLATVVATMGITLGTLLCVLTLAYILIVSPLPYPEQENLYRLDNLFVKGENEVLGNYLIYPAMVQVHKRNEIFDKTTLTFDGETIIESDPLQPKIYINYVTPEWFSLLGAEPFMGRVLESSESLDSNNPVAVLSYNSWQTLFASDANILDKKVLLNGVSYSVVGVLHQSFIEPQIRHDGQKTDIFVPWDFNPIRQSRGQSWQSPHPNISMFGSLTRMTENQASQTLTASIDEVWQGEVFGVEFWKGYRVEIELRQLKDVILGDFRKTVYLLLAAVSGLVLIALANISNLFVSRTAEQQRGLAIRAAMGASKKQLFLTLLAETGLLLLISIVVAILLAQAGFSLLQHYFALHLPRVAELSLNIFTFTSAVFIAVVLALFFARLSSNMIDYRQLKASLHSSGKGAGIQVSKKLRKTLVLCQVAMVFTLIFINLVIFNESIGMITRPLGFSTENIHLLRLNTRAKSAQEIVPVIDEMTKRLNDLPMIDAVSQSYSPLGTFDLISLTSSRDASNTMVEFIPVDNHYFELINQTIIEGNAISEIDVRDGNKVMVIEEPYAKKLAPDGSAVGIRLTNDENETYTIIGVAREIQIPGKREAALRAYAPFSPDRYRLQILLKLSPGQALEKESLIAMINNIDSIVRFRSEESLDKKQRELLFAEIVTVVTSSVLTIVSYLLAAIGLYGVLSYGTQLRRFELGTRMAIGAKRKDIVWLVVEDNSPSMLRGIMLGVLILVAIYLSFSDRLDLFINPALAFTFGITLFLVVSISLFASYWPLRKLINRPVVFSLKDSE